MAAAAAAGDDYANYAAHIALFIKAQETRLQRSLPHGLAVHVKQLAKTLADAGVLRIRRGMPSLGLAASHDTALLYWPNVGPLDEFRVHVTCTGVVYCVIFGEARQDTVEKLIDVLKDWNSRDQ